MSNRLGYAIFPSTWHTQKEQLASLFYEGSAVFTSLHIQEEFNKTYVETVYEMLAYCKALGYQIIADISPRTLEKFGFDDIKTLFNALKVDVFRLDFGFSLEDVLEASKVVPICLNASTLTLPWLEAIKHSETKFYAMHNYYPRPETGLDEAQFMARNSLLKQYDIEIMAFVPSDTKKRGPIYEGLPTLEHHRKSSPYAAFAEMVLKYDVHWVFIGDGILSNEENAWIKCACENELYALPIKLYEPDGQYAHEIYTIRPDSPADLLRLLESRDYATPGVFIAPHHTIERKKGSLTLDNLLYQRYSGEMQITRKDYKSDPRVNVLGTVPDKFHSLLEALPNGVKIQIVPYAHKN